MLATVLTMPVTMAIAGTVAALEAGTALAWLTAAVQIATAGVATVVAVAILQLDDRPRSQPLWLLDRRGLRLRRRRARLAELAGRSDGQAMLEYALILTLVVTLAAAAMAIVGVDLSALVDGIVDDVA